MIQEVLEEGNDSTKAYFYLALKTQFNESSATNTNNNNDNNSLITKPLYATYTQVINALCNNNNNKQRQNNNEYGSIQRAQSLLKTLKQKIKLGEVIYTKGEITNVKNLYHVIMKAWIRTNQKIVPIRLMELYNDMLDDDYNMKEKDGSFIGIRDEETYQLVLDGWSTSKIPNAYNNVIEILEHMEEISKDDQQSSLIIELSHYKSILKTIYNDAYKSSLNDPYPPMYIAAKGYNILLGMEQRYKISQDSIDAPDLECYTYVLKSLAQCVSREYEPMIEFLHQKMESNSSLPISISTYEIVLKALTNCTHEDASKISNDLLFNTLIPKYTNGDRNFADLSKEYFKLVLQSYANANNDVTKDCGERAQDVVDTLQQLFTKKQDEKFELDVDIYTLVLKCYNKHPSIQERLYKANYYLQYIEQSQTLQPTIQLYNAYLNLKSTCYIPNNQIQNRATLLSSIQTLQRLVDTHNIIPNSTTFQYLFQACEQLLPHTNEDKEQKNRILQDMFTLCCKYQAVTNDILDMYKNAISLNVYRSSTMYNDYSRKILNDIEKDDDKSFLTMNRIGKKGGDKTEQRLLRGGRLV